MEHTHPGSTQRRGGGGEEEKTHTYIVYMYMQADPSPLACRRTPTTHTVNSLLHPGSKEYCETLHQAQFAGASVHLIRPLVSTKRSPTQQEVCHTEIFHLLLLSPSCLSHLLSITGTNVFLTTSFCSDVQEGIRYLSLFYLANCAKISQLVNSVRTCVRVF